MESFNFPVFLPNILKWQGGEAEHLSILILLKTLLSAPHKTTKTTTTKTELQELVPMVPTHLSPMVLIPSILKE